MSRPRLRLPSSARPGEIIEIRTLVDHPMVTGLSSPGPRDMLARFVARMNGEIVFEAELGNGTSANPYLAFFVRIEKTSDFVFTWTHENGSEIVASATVSV